MKTLKRVKGLLREFAFFGETRAHAIEFLLGSTLQRTQFGLFGAVGLELHRTRFNLFELVIERLYFALGDLDNFVVESNAKFR